jgi:hypothetical protein
MSPRPLPTDIATLRERLRQMSVLELRARGREALRQCRPEAQRFAPLSDDESLVAEIYSEWRRRFPTKPRRQELSHRT